MSVLAHVKVTPSTIPQLSNRPIMMALLDQRVNYYYSNWPLALTARKMAAAEEAWLVYFLWGEEWTPEKYRRDGAASADLGTVRKCTSIWFVSSGWHFWPPRTNQHQLRLSINTVKCIKDHVNLHIFFPVTKLPCAADGPLNWFSFLSRQTFLCHCN